MRRGAVAAAGMVVGTLALGAAFLALRPAAPDDPGAWTEEERRVLASMSLTALGPPRPDPSNAHADDPAAARLGRALFFDPALSATGTISCASCHRPEKAFADDVPLSLGAAGPAARNTPSLVAASWSPWQGWAGHADSAWSQALGPLERRGEHGMSRTALVRALASRHASAYEACFGPLPPTAGLPAAAGPEGTPEERAAWERMDAGARASVDAVFARAGKALQAYERTLRPAPSRFDAYADAVAAGEPSGALAPDEVAGLRLFIGRAGCTQCHSGPLLTNHEFQGIGLPPLPGAALDAGRRDGVVELLRDPFNCLGAHSDAGPEDCGELRFVKAQGDELLAAMKVPSLRHVARTAPYMHDGRMPDLRAVLLHYDEAPEPLAGHSDLKPLGLTEEELAQLEAFLRALDAPVIDPLAPTEPPPALAAGALPARAAAGMIRGAR